MYNNKDFKVIKRINWMSFFWIFEILIILFEDCKKLRLFFGFCENKKNLKRRKKD